jgi:hypothetical protein
MIRVMRRRCIFVGRLFCGRLFHIPRHFGGRRRFGRFWGAGASTFFGASPFSVWEHPGRNRKTKTINRSAIFQ